MKKKPFPKEAIPVVANEYAEPFSEWSEAAGKTLIAFANTRGGDLYFGSEAKGLSRAEAAGIEYDALCFARQGVDPPVQNKLSFQRLATQDGLLVLKLTVYPSPDVPYALRGKLLTGGCFLREGAENVLATEQEILRMIRESDPSAWEAMPCREWNLTFRGAEEYFREAGQPFDSEHFHGLGLRDLGGYTNLATLLSDQNPSQIVFTFPEAKSADAKGRTLSGSLLRQVRDGFDLMRGELPISVGDSGKVSEGFPEQALHAALILCAVHRDYSVAEPLKVTCYRDRIEFVARGCALGGFARDDYVIDYAMNCRNFELSAIFMRLKWATDDDMMFISLSKAYAGSGFDPGPETTRRTFRIVLPIIIRKADRKSLIERGRKLFEEFDNMSTTDVMQRLEVSRSSAIKIVQALEKEGMIEKVGMRRATRYIRRNPGTAKGNEAGDVGTRC